MSKDITIKILKRNTKNNIGKIITILTFSIICVLIQTVITADMISKITDSVMNIDKSLLMSSIKIFLNAILIYILLNALTKKLKFMVEKKFVMDFENYTLNHYKDIMFWQESIGKDDFISIFRNNIQQIGVKFLNYIMEVIQFIFTMIFTSLYVININPISLIINIIILALLIMITRKDMNNVSSLWESRLNSQNKLYNKLRDRIINSEIASLLNEDRLNDKFINCSNEYVENMIIHKKVFNKFDLANALGGILTIIVTIFIGTFFIQRNKLQIPELLSLVIIMPMIANSLFSLPALISRYKEFKGEFNIVDKVLSLPKENYNDHVELNNNIEKIDINNLSFKYKNNESNTISDLSFNCIKGEFLCITGKSGIGKSTILKVIAKLLPDDKSSVTVNDILLNKIDRNTLWKKVAYINQDPAIVHGTLIYNITLQNNNKIDLNRLSKAISDANLTDLVEASPNGLETIIDTSNVSNGELQKICLARAFYKDYDVLLLDEPTSAMDPVSELMILQGIKRRVQKEKLMVISVSHRENFIKEASKIIELNEEKSLKSI